MVLLSPGQRSSGRAGRSLSTTDHTRQARAFQGWRLLALPVRQARFLRLRQVVGMRGAAQPCAMCWWPGWPFTLTTQPERPHSKPVPFKAGGCWRYQRGGHT